VPCLVKCKLGKISFFFICNLCMKSGFLFFHFFIFFMNKQKNCEYWWYIGVIRSNFYFIFLSNICIGIRKCSFFEIYWFIYTLTALFLYIVMYRANVNTVFVRRLLGTRPHAKKVGIFLPKINGKAVADQFFRVPLQATGQH
jgi:hypothetical protein